MSAKSPARTASQGAPPSSPRLPSPPPLPELQLGPRSPSINAPVGELSLDNAAIQDDGAARRVRPGTSAVDMARGPPFVPLHQLETPFQLQEYLKSSYANLTRGNAAHTIKPITKEMAMQLATPPTQQDTGEPVDRNLWLYELCRFLVQRTNRLIVSFFADHPACSSQTCPEMRASEWQYLCAVHEPPKSCCAIDYCCHTLDWAANVLTSTKHFPSRLTLGGEGGSAYQSMRQLTNIFRRVYRIYAHAWFQHREAFWMLEQEEGLYKFFRTVCDAYTLIPEDNYTIPPEAEGDKEDVVETPISNRGVDIHILQNDVVSNEQHQPQPPPQPEPAPAPSLPATAPTQRRHRHTPSTGTQVTMIAEGTEEEEEEASANTILISQQVPAEPTASSTRATASPPKPTRSPRPDMSIPINQPTAENLRVPEDPTPTPERHNSDPFALSASVAATQAATASVTAVPDEEPPTAKATRPPPSALTATTSADVSEPFPTSRTPPMPPLQTQVSTTQVPADDEQEVRSPTGGSIRTVGHDILSGLIAHVDDEDHRPAVVAADTTKAPDSKTEEEPPPYTSESFSAPSSTASSESEWSVIEKENENENDVEAKQDNQKDALDKKEQDSEKEAEADEEMGEIKLETVATAVKDEPVENTPAPDEPTVKVEEKGAEASNDDVESKEKEKVAEESKEPEKETAKDDTTTKQEESPAGVV